MHSCIIWRKLQPKGIKISIQGTSSTHNYTFQTRLFLQFTSQFLNPITLESKRIPLHNLIIHFAIIFSHMIVYSPPFRFWRWTVIRFTRLQSKKPIKSKNLLQLNNTRLIITSTKIQFLYPKKISNLLSRKLVGFDWNRRGWIGIEIQRILMWKWLRWGLLWDLSRRLDLNLDNINIPENPILSGSPVRNIMGDRVSPRWYTTIGSQEVTIPSLELDLGPFFNGFPLERRVEPPRQRLDHFSTSHAKQKGLVRGGEVLVVATLEPDYAICAFDKLDSPPCVFGRPVSILDHRLFIFIS